VFFPVTTRSSFRSRRQQVAKAAGSTAVLVAAGLPLSRNYPANHHPFRASSHFLYLATARENNFLLLDGGKTTLFAEAPDRDDALWHGPRPELAQVAESEGVDEVCDVGQLAQRLEPLRDRLGVLPPQDGATRELLARVAGRPIAPNSPAGELDARDAAARKAMFEARLIHDEAAQDQLRAAAVVSSQAHLEGMRATRAAERESEIEAAISHVLRRHGMQYAYGPIATVRGEVLHSRASDNTVRPGDLFLCDMGGETPEGWASDITRTWPISGRFSKTQRAIYEVVLSANQRAIAKVRPGVSYRAVHEEAKRALVEGLVALGIFRGSVDGLLERGAASLFFPHGVGHLLGLDVHDMEDFGDFAGYAEGRVRSKAFGDRYLRLDRDLAPGMAVTIEPGFYQVPGILHDPALTGPLGEDLNLDVLAHYDDVRGIRIEDDVLCTSGEPEVMTHGCPKTVAELEAALHS
jgi:Xaa-Pro aminopeptidase